MAAHPDLRVSNIGSSVHRFCPHGVDDAPGGRMPGDFHVPAVELAESLPAWNAQCRKRLAAIRALAADKLHKEQDRMVAYYNRI